MNKKPPNQLLRWELSHNPADQLLLFVFIFLFYVTLAVFLLEPLYTPCGIDIFLLTGIKRMAHRADFGVDFLGRAAGFESGAAAAVNYDLFIFWMYIFFHN